MTEVMTVEELFRKWVNDTTWAWETRSCYQEQFTKDLKALIKSECEKMLPDDEVAEKYIPDEVKGDSAEIYGFYCGWVAKERAIKQRINKYGED